ncbi:25390_t:CDS:1, partial [Racocetra persica]
MSKSPSNFIILLMICMTFFRLIRGNYVAYADYPDTSERSSPLIGRFTWKETSTNVTRLNGNFMSGFDDPDINNYSFSLEDDHEVIYDFSKNIRESVKVVDHGITPYEECFENGVMRPRTIIGLKCVIKYKDEIIGNSPVRH